MNGPRLVSDRASSDEERVAKLLRLAGHRPAVPAGDAEIVKQAARAEWLRTVKAERRRAYLTRGAGGLLAAAATVLLVFRTDFVPRLWPPSDEPVARVDMVTGQVLATFGENDAVDLAGGAALPPGATVETAALGAGEPARVAFRLADGTSIRLDVGTRVRFLSASELALEHGRLYADSGPEALQSAGALEIHTSLGVARDIGTQFIVRAGAPDSDLAILVREGEVVLDRDGQPSESVDAGSRLTVMPDGSVERAPLASFGSSWDWTLSVLPPFLASGRSLHEVLAWAARESGWQLSYADSIVAETAAATVVDGPTDGMTPEDVVATFLLASGELSYRLDGGVLRIEPPH